MYKFLILAWPQYLLIVVCLFTQDVWPRRESSFCMQAQSNKALFRGGFVRTDYNTALDCINGANNLIKS